MTELDDLDDLDPSADVGRPLRRIVVGVDFSDGSDHALAHALGVARRVGAAVTLVHVGIVAEAPEVPSSMAITAHAYREVLLGSVAEHTVRLAAASVLVARGAAPAGGYRRIVVGADFSPRTDVAVDRALALAAPDAAIDVVHCWEPPSPLADDGDLDTMARHLRARGGPPLRVIALDEAPDRGLARYADRVSADLLVVASHGRRGLDRVLLGSVAEATVRRAACSVLVAR